MLTVPWLFRTPASRSPSKPDVQTPYAPASSCTSHNRHYYGHAMKCHLHSPMVRCLLTLSSLNISNCNFDFDFSLQFALQLWQRTMNWSWRSDHGLKFSIKSRYLGNLWKKLARMLCIATVSITCTYRPRACSRFACFPATRRANQLLHFSFVFILYLRLHLLFCSRIRLFSSHLLIQAPLWSDNSALQLSVSLATWSWWGSSHPSPWSLSGFVSSCGYYGVVGFDGSVGRRRKHTSQSIS